MTELIFCLAALLIGPFLYQLSRARQTLYACFDGFVLVGVGGLVLLEILPDTFAALGVIAFPIAVFGFLFPHLLEHRLDSLPVSPRTILSGLIIIGLVLHQLLDGAALRVPEQGGEHAVTALGIAVILHQLPKGFLLWDITRKASGFTAASLVILGLLAATGAGFFLGGEVLRLVQHEWVLGFQAFVSGGLLHVVVHHVSGGSEGGPRSALAFASGAGALVAGALFAWMPEAHFIEPLSPGGQGFRSAFWNLALESAPPILLGCVCAGLLQGFVTLKSLRWFEGRTRLSQALRGVVLGIPLPICSCGVTPIYHTLVSRGVPVAAALSFLIATPEIGLDSFFLSLGLLGVQITLIRLGMAFAIALLAGCLLARLYSGALRPVPGASLESIGGASGSRSLAEKVRISFRYAAVDLIDHLGAWLALGIVIAAVLEPHLRPEWFTGLPPGLDVVLLALAGLPIYVCASGATPLAAVLLAKGVSPGAVLAFLITGPTTNVTTFGVLSRLHGPLRAAALPATVFTFSVLFGIGLNIAGGFSGAQLPSIAEHSHGPLERVCAILLGILLAASVLRLGPRRFLGKLVGEGSLGHSHEHAHDHAEAEACGP